MSSRRPRRHRTSPDLVVLQSLRVVRPTTNPYLIMLVRGLEAAQDVTVRYFGYRTALLGSYDVFHVHWPEILLEGRTPLRRLARQLLLVGILLRITLRRTPIVRTLHNVERPEGLRWHEHRLLDWLDARTELVILLNGCTPTPAGSRGVVIPHGHYREWFADQPRRSAVPGRFGYVGLIRRYKGVENLIAAFAGVEDSASCSYSLAVAGKPSTDQLTDQMVRLAEPDQRVSLLLHFLDDRELVDTVTASELIVLPYRFMHNSGSVLAALSLDRPVLVPANAVNRELAEEVGGAWVQTYTGELSADHLAQAIRRVQSITGDRPDLSGREWGDGVRRHIDAYRSALTGSRTTASTGVTSSPAPDTAGEGSRR